MTMPRCDCGRFVNPDTTRPLGWYRHGEFGEDTGYVCPACVPKWKPQDSRGRGPEAGYCGVLVPAQTSGQEEA